MTRVVGVLLCAGASTRMGFDKLLVPLAGRTAIERSLHALIEGGVDAVVFAASESGYAFVQDIPCAVEKRVVRGGDTRAQSVKNALAAVEDADFVAIHDAARCMVSPQAVRASIESARRFGSGIVSAHAVDTTLMLENGAYRALDRTRLIHTQTPQTFRFDQIKRAYESELQNATDDCAYYMAAGYTPHFVFVDGGQNRKLTGVEDWLNAQAAFARVGTGYDTHRLVEGRRLILGGVEIPYEKGLLGHSDADALTHAVMDALLGAAGMGDIGALFPDTDARYAGANSVALLRVVAERLHAISLRVQHVDATIIAERPRLMPHIPLMRERLAAAMGVSADAVSIKATTTEGMNDEGRGLCISAMAVASLA